MQATQETCRWGLDQKQTGLTYNACALDSLQKLFTTEFSNIPTRSMFFLYFVVKHPSFEALQPHGLQTTNGEDTFLSSTKNKKFRNYDVVKQIIWLACIS